MAMYKTVLIRVFAAVLCLGLTAQSLFARPVKHGAMDICATVDQGTVSTVDGTEVCCAHERRRTERAGECRADARFGRDLLL